MTSIFIVSLSSRGWCGSPVNTPVGSSDFYCPKDLQLVTCSVACSVQGWQCVAITICYSRWWRISSVYKRVHWWSTKQLPYSVSGHPVSQYVDMLYLHAETSNHHTPSVSMARYRAIAVCRYWTPRDWEILVRKMWEVDYSEPTLAGLHHLS